MQLTGGQSKFEFLSTNNSESAQNSKSESDMIIADIISDLPIIKLTSSEKKAHEKRVKEIEKKYSVNSIWKKFT